MPDTPEIYDKLKGIEYLNFIADMYDIPRDIRQERMDKYLDIFNLNHAIGDIIASYSHGMKQKLVLISALLHDPKLFILDEPMVGLDPKSSFQLKEIMRERCDKGIRYFLHPCIEVAEKYAIG